MTTVYNSFDNEFPQNDNVDRRVLTNCCLIYWEFSDFRGSVHITKMLCCMRSWWIGERLCNGARTKVAAPASSILTWDFGAIFPDPWRTWPVPCWFNFRSKDWCDIVIGALLTWYIMQRWVTSMEGIYTWERFMMHVLVSFLYVWVHARTEGVGSMSFLVNSLIALFKITRQTHQNTSKTRSIGHHITYSIFRLVRLYVHNPKLRLHSLAHWISGLHRPSPGSPGLDRLHNPVQNCEHWQHKPCSRNLDFLWQRHVPPGYREQLHCQQLPQTQCKRQLSGNSTLGIFNWAASTWLKLHHQSMC